MIDLSAFEGQYTPEQLAAAQAILASKPEQIAQHTLADGSFNLPGFIDGTVGWWSDFGHTVSDKLDQFAPELALMDAMGYAINPEAAGEVGTFAPNDPSAIPLEQQLLQTVIENYGNPDMAADAGRRDEANRIVADVNRSLDGALRINDELVSGAFDSTGYLTANPDVAAWAQQAVAGGSFPDLAAAARHHYEAFGKAEGRQANFVTRLQQENQTADDTAARLAKSAADAAQTRLDALDQRKVEMTAALDRMQGDRSGALDAQTAQLRTALGQLEGERQAALKQLTDARLAAAEGLVTGINVGLESERDRLTAERAAQGYVGGSSMDTTNMLRATINARQAAAETVGSARVANAGDARALGDEIAGTRFNITGNDATARRGIAEDTAKGRFNLDDALSTSRVGVADQLATGQQTAADAGAKLRLAYFDNDLTRRQQASLVPATLGAQRLALLDAAGAAGQSGLTRTLNNLNWFASSATPPSTTPAFTAPSQVGNDIAALGAGLVRGGFSAANSAGWENLFGKKTPAATERD